MGAFPRGRSGPSAVGLYISLVSYFGLLWEPSSPEHHERDPNDQ